MGQKFDLAIAATGELDGLIGEYPLKILQFWWVRWPLGTLLLLWVFSKFVYRVARLVTISISSVVVFIKDPEHPLPARMVDGLDDYETKRKSLERERKMFEHEAPVTGEELSLYWGERGEESDIGREGRYADTILARPRAFLGGGFDSTRWWVVWFALVSGKSKSAPLMCYAREFLNVLLVLVCMASATTVLMLALSGVVGISLMSVVMGSAAVILVLRFYYVRYLAPYEEEEHYGHWFKEQRRRLSHHSEQDLEQ